jgi:hypothetical protein
MSVEAHPALLLANRFVPAYAQPMRDRRYNLDGEIIHTEKIKDFKVVNFKTATAELCWATAAKAAPGVYPQRYGATELSYQTAHVMNEYLNKQRDTPFVTPHIGFRVLQAEWNAIFGEINIHSRIGWVLVDPVDGITYVTGFSPESDRNAYSWDDQGRPVWSTANLDWQLLEDHPDRLRQRYQEYGKNRWFPHFGEELIFENSPERLGCMRLKVIIKD